MVKKTKKKLIVEKPIVEIRTTALSQIITGPNGGDVKVLTQHTEYRRKGEIIWTPVPVVEAHR
jgi:hypothetical protein